MFTVENGRKALLEIAEVLDDCCVPYFLIQGTALGSWRDGGFVPSEKDIDIGILQENWRQSFTYVVSRFLDRGYEIETYSAPFQQCRTLVVKLHGVKADLVGVMRWQDKRFVASPVNPWVDKPYCIVHDADVLETYRTVDLFGRTFRIPADIETYLQREYGRWKTPVDDHVSRTRIYNFLQDNGINDATVA